MGPLPDLLLNARVFCVAWTLAQMQSGDLPDIRPGEVLQGKVTDDAPEVLTDALIDRDLEEPARGARVLLRVEEGETCTIDLCSYFFDAYLVVRDASGEVLAEDDDGGLHTHAQVVLQGLETGPALEIEATALHGDRGPFTLTVTEGLPEELTEAERRAAELHDRRLAVSAREETLGRDHHQTAASLHDLATALREQGQYAEALVLLERVLAIRKAVLEPDHPDLAVSLNELGLVFKKLGQYERARPLYEHALAIREATLGPDHPATAASLNNLGLVFQGLGEYEQAEPLLERALAIREASPESIATDVPESLNNLAMLLEEQDRYEEAQSLLERAVMLFEEVLGPDHVLTAVALNNLALVLQDQRLDDEAQPLYERALGIWEKTLGPDHPQTAEGLNNVALLLAEQGRFEEARPLYERALGIMESKLGADHPSTAICLGGLAVLLRDMGQYEEARPLFERALTACENSLGPDHPLTATSLGNLASILHDQGLYEQAQRLDERALAIRERALGPDHPQTAESMNNVALLLREQGLMDEARSLLERALAIREGALGPDHPDTAASRHNLAGLLHGQGLLEEARPHYERALATMTPEEGPDPPQIHATLNNLAGLLHEQGLFEEARPLLERALALSRSGLGEDHLYMARSFLNLATMYEREQRWEEALQCHLRSLTIRRALLLRQLPVLSERERFVWAGQHRHALDRMLLLSSSHPGLLDAQSCYAEVLAFKGIVSRGVLADRRWHQEHTDPEVLALQERLARVLAEISGAFTESSVDRPLETLRKEREALERQLAAHRGFQESARLLTPSEVRAALAPDEALVDFLLYEAEGEKRLTAFVVRPDFAVERIELSPGSESSAELGTDPLAEIHLRGSWLRGGAVVGGNVGRRVPEVLWEPLRPYLTSARRIFLCPDGVLATLPWEAIPGPEPGTYLIEDHAFVYLETPDLLVRERTEVPASLGFLVAGGIDYDACEATPHRGSTDARGLRGLELSWRPLAGTGAEVEDLASYFESTRPEEPCILLRGAAATEEAVKQAAPGKRFLHLATHGYFAPEHLHSRLDEARRLADDEDWFFLEERRTQLAGWYPGLLSGVVLAGANHRASGPGEDGILTAEEVLWLDLQDCELVTLSACETGLGAAKAGEHLQGLRRALHLAGARSTVTSLWKVDDRATRELMGEFYQRLWVKGESKSDALRNSQLALLRRNRAQHGKALPETWGAFVLEGDWR